VVTAGRIMANRDQGKVHFMDLMTRTGRMQIFIKGDNIGQEAYEYGSSVRSRRYYSALKAKHSKLKPARTVSGSPHYHVLSKSWQTLPEKWHGLKDVDIRYRQRYVDLIANPEGAPGYLSKAQPHYFLCAIHFSTGKVFLK